MAVHKCALGVCTGLNGTYPSWSLVFTYLVLVGFGNMVFLEELSLWERALGVSRTSHCSSQSVLHGYGSRWREPSASAPASICLLLPLLCHLEL